MTQRYLSVRLKEHAIRLSSGAVGEHFSVCEHAQYLAFFTKPVYTTQ